MKRSVELELLPRLPEDLWYEILCRFPIIHSHRLFSVCHQWRRLMPLARPAQLQYWQQETARRERVPSDAHLIERLTGEPPINTQWLAWVWELAVCELTVTCAVLRRLRPDYKMTFQLFRALWTRQYALAHLEQLPRPSAKSDVKMQHVYLLVQTADEAVYYCFPQYKQLLHRVDYTQRAIRVTTRASQVHLPLQLLDLCDVPIVHGGAIRHEPRQAVTFDLLWHLDNTHRILSCFVAFTAPFTQLGEALETLWHAKHIARRTERIVEHELGQCDCVDSTPLQCEAMTVRQ